MAESTNRFMGPKKSKDNKNSLSTITEEPKSMPTETTKTGSKVSLQKFPSEIETTSKLSPFYNGGNVHEHKRLREYSKVLKKSSREIILPRDTLRTKALEEQLLSHINFSGKPLFTTVLADQLYPTLSVLVKGSGLRSIAELQESLHISDHKKIQNVYRVQRTHDEESVSSSRSYTTSSLHDKASETQTDTPPLVDSRNQVMYMLGVSNTEEEDEYLTEYKKESGEKGCVRVSESMKLAQKYLRKHQIFQFFQFIIAHLLSALPECLFFLMDKMRTGYIDLHQYKTGMRTVGICSFNEYPKVTCDGRVIKTTFIEEAYDCLCNLLNDMIGSRTKTIPSSPTASLTEDYYQYLTKECVGE